MTASRQVESIAVRLEQLGYGFQVGYRPWLQLQWKVLMTDNVGTVIGPPDAPFDSARLSTALAAALVWAEANPRSVR